MRIRYEEHAFKILGFLGSCISSVPKRTSDPFILSLLTIEKVPHSNHDAQQLLHHLMWDTYALPFMYCTMISSYFQTFVCFVAETKGYEIFSSLQTSRTSL